VQIRAIRGQNSYLPLCIGQSFISPDISFDFIGQESLSLQHSPFILQTPSLQQSVIGQLVFAVELFDVYAKAAIENAKSINATTEMMIFFFIMYFPFYLNVDFQS
jgi:hypothetical protein